jgi:predicted RNA-binding Zn-ribbon protein involved in translation (DUF1610 family)
VSPSPGAVRPYVPMKCPACGGEMNRHAVKVAEPRSMAEASRVDPVFGGVLIEAHTCPACGKNAWRQGARA